MAIKKEQEQIEFETMSEKLSKQKFRTTESSIDLKLFNNKGELNTKRINKLSLYPSSLLLLLMTYVYINVLFLMNNAHADLNTFTQWYIMKDFADNIYLVVIENYTYSNFNEYILLAILIVSITVFILINKRIKSKIENKRFITEVLHNVGLSDKIYFIKSEDKEDYERYVFRMYKHANFNGLMTSFEANSKKEFLILTKFEDVFFEPDKKDKSIYYLNIIKVPFPSMFDEEVAQLNKDLNTKHKQKGKHILGYTNIAVKDVKGLTQKKVGNLFIDYFDLDEILIHMLTIGAAGSGKSVSFANTLNTHLNNLDKTAILFIHDAGSVENVKVQKWIDNHPQKEYLSKKIYTSSTLDELEKILIKLKLIYEYRILTMNKSGDNLYQGKMIILKADEVNIMMTALSDTTSAIGKQAKRIDKFIEDFALLFRKAHIYLDFMGQSDLVQDNFNSTVKKQCQIKFGLKNDGYIATEFCKIAQEESNYHLNEFKKGEVLLYNSNNQDYTKFLGAYVGDDYLDKNHSKITEVEPHILDLEMYDYVEQLEDKTWAEYLIVMDKERKGLTSKELEKLDVEINDYKELLQNNIKELSKGIFLQLDKKTFELIDKDKYRKNKDSSYQIPKKEEPKVLDLDKKEEEKPEITNDFNYIKKEISKATDEETQIFLDESEEEQYQIENNNIDLDEELLEDFDDEDLALNKFILEKEKELKNKNKIVDTEDLTF